MATGKYVGATVPPKVYRQLAFMARVSSRSLAGMIEFCVGEMYRRDFRAAYIEELAESRKRIGVKKP